MPLAVYYLLYGYYIHLIINYSKTFTFKDYIYIQFLKF